MESAQLVQFQSFVKSIWNDVDEEFIQIFAASASLKTWIDSETAQKYLQYTRLDNLKAALKKFKINIHYKELTRDEFLLLSAQEQNEMLRVNTDQDKKKKQHGGQNKKYYLISPETFKGLLLMRDTENGQKYRDYMIKLESLFIDFLNHLFNQQKEQIQNKNHRLSILNDEIAQLQQDIHSIQHPNTLFGIFKLEEDGSIDMKKPQLVCYSSKPREYYRNRVNILKEEDNENDQDFDYQMHIYQSNLNSTEARLNRDIILKDLNLEGPQTTSRVTVNRLTVIEKTNSQDNNINDKNKLIERIVELALDLQTKKQ